MKCEQKVRYKKSGVQYNKVPCGAEATHLDTSDISRVGGRPLCYKHFAKWLDKAHKYKEKYLGRKVNKRSLGRKIPSNIL
jgi:hypothetical protein